MEWPISAIIWIHHCSMGINHIQSKCTLQLFVWTDTVHVVSKMKERGNSDWKQTASELYLVEKLECGNTVKVKQTTNRRRTKCQIIDCTLTERDKSNTLPLCLCHRGNQWSYISRHRYGHSVCHQMSFSVLPSALIAESVGCTNGVGC